MTSPIIVLYSHSLRQSQYLCARFVKVVIYTMYNVHVCLKLNLPPSKPNQSLVDKYLRSYMHCFGTNYDYFHQIRVDSCKHEPDTNKTNISMILELGY